MKADYGVDDPRVPAVLALAGLGALVIAVVGVVLGIVGLWVSFGITALSCIGGAASYMYATLRGKHRAWATILDSMGLRGSETVLDVGCGRGAVLIAAAHRLPRGRAVGIDIWTIDQSGNRAAATRRNAELEGVAGRVSLATADARHLPFPADTFDVVVSSLVIHNISSADGRRQALDEALRVLRPGGRVFIADIFSVGSYPADLDSAGAAHASIRDLGPGTWFGNPFVRTRLVTGSKSGGQSADVEVERI